MDKRKTSAVSRNVARLMLISATLGRPMTATPGIPADRIKILREAYVKAFREPEVIEEAKKKRFELTTLSGEEVEAEMREIMNQPSEVIERVRKLSQ
jgi:tripartite-type tricarboxylate transporter receptor subunit TctC